MLTWVFFCFGVYKVPINYQSSIFSFTGKKPIMDIESNDGGQHEHIQIL